MTSRVLIIVFDALRPEFVTPDLMPRLTAFAEAGAWFRNHHSVFPTETRVNQSSVVTGCYPARHGVVANQFPLGGGVLNTGKDALLQAALAGMDAPLLERPALGDHVAEAGLRYASISAGTSGGGRLINLSAEATGSFRFALRRPEAACPAGVADRIADRVGPVPDYQRPAVGWNRHAARIWLDWVETEIGPDVSLLWLCEPDESFHWHGIGAPESLEAIRGVDTVFGEILDAKAAEIADGALHVIAMSDHGQISLGGGKIDLAGQMCAAGLAAASQPGPEIDYTVVIHSAGGIWVRDSDPGLTARAVDWLRAQPWCGPVFTRIPLDDTLPIASLMADHDRAPDIYLTLSHDDRSNTWGRAGTSADNAPYPEFGGCHGGLSRHELHNVLAIGGASIVPGHHDEPTGNVDILPTVLRLAGITVPGDLDGRVLDTAFGGTAPEQRETTRQAGDSHLTTQTVGTTSYLHRGWREPVR